MNKDNIFRSSEFYMQEGDVLHFLILDEVGTPIEFALNTINADGSDSGDEVPDPPVAISASDITSSSFVANWYFSESTQGFYLDVATDIAFTSMVAGYNNLDVGLVNEYPVVGLNDAYVYYYRLRGYNDIGTGGNSNVITLTTLNEPVVDFDGNLYTYVTIGTQQWLVENFRCEHYIDGTVIPNLTLDADWIADATGAYCWYDNNIVNKSLYGGLYNQFAIDNVHGLGITGWRVPSEGDINTLIATIGGSAVAGGVLKEAGMSRWNTPNTGAMNSYGFTAVGGGYRIQTTGGFYNKNIYGWYWTSTSAGGGNSALRGMTYNSISSFDYDDDDNLGISVRLMRDI